MGNRMMVSPCLLVSQMVAGADQPHSHRVRRSADNRCRPVIQLHGKAAPNGSRHFLIGVSRKANLLFLGRVQAPAPGGGLSMEQVD
jgi:hypothetical protein